MPSISSDMRALYDAHFDLVWRYMAQRSVRQADIDDLVHKVFRVVREHPRRYTMPQKPSVLVCMVARQVLREYQHTESNTLKADDADALTEIFERDAVSEMVLGGLESMTDIEREAYLLCDGEGMSMEDVALAVGVPELAVQRKRARANKQMNEFLAKMRTTALWRTSQRAADEDLLRTLHAACTPTDRDRDRVFAAMIAYSLTTRPSRVPRESAAAATPLSNTPLPSLSAPFVRPPAPSAAEGTPRLLSVSWLPKRVGPRSSRVWLAAGLAAALVVVGMGSLLASTHAAEKPRVVSTPIEAPSLAVRQDQEAQPQTGARAEQAGATTRPLAATPEVTVTEQPSPTVNGAGAAAEVATPEVTATEQPSPPANGADAVAVAETPDSKPVHVSEAKLLFAAERAYLNGNATLALAMLGKHRRLYPSTAYTVERKVLQGQVLCTKARHREAQRVALELESMDVNPAALAALYRVCSGKDER